MRECCCRRSAHLRLTRLFSIIQKPYRCEVVGCSKRYTDPSSLRKHVKSHTAEEQLQYRRFKDQANAAKRSSSPFSSSSSAAAAAAQLPPPPPPPQTQHWATATAAAAAREQAPPTPTPNNSAHFSASSVTMLAVGLQSGGTCVLEAPSSVSPTNAVVSGPMQQQLEQHRESKHTAAAAATESVARARGIFYHGGVEEKEQK